MTAIYTPHASPSTRDLVDVPARKAGLKITCGVSVMCPCLFVPLLSFLSNVYKHTRRESMTHTLNQIQMRAKTKLSHLKL
jgi:hypothetical protein